MVVAAVVAAGRAEQHAIGIVRQPRVFLGFAGAAVGNTIDRLEGVRDVVAHLLHSPELQGHLAGVAQFDCGLLFFPVGDNHGVAQGRDSDGHRTGIQFFLVAFQDLVAGDAVVLELADGGKGDLVTRLAGQIVLDVDDGVFISAHVPLVAVLAHVLHEELIVPLLGSETYCGGSFCHDLPQVFRMLSSGVGPVQGGTLRAPTEWAVARD
ncbi:hypothetical protein FQZ97_856590 [compost metagenome]